VVGRCPSTSSIQANYLRRAIENIDMKLEGRSGVCEKRLACGNTILYECILDLQIRMFLLLRVEIQIFCVLPGRV
jgi:hypothetical protein